MVRVDGATWQVVKATHWSSTTEQEARSSVGQPFLGIETLLTLNFDQIHLVVEGITYCSSSKGCMSAQMFVNYFNDLSINQQLKNNRTRKSWIESCSIHNESHEILETLNVFRTELKRFHHNCTSTAQPLDQLLLRSFKAEWRER